jgi:hypothetical protein
MSAGQLSAGTVFEVKCLFAIDAIAAVYRAALAGFENAPGTSLSEFGSAIAGGD